MLLRRPVIVLAALVVALTVVTGAARTGTAVVTGSAYAARGQGSQGALRLAQAPAGFVGGPTTASDGETVNVLVEDALVEARPDAVQHWADTLTGLLHGPEVSDVTVYVATFDRVRQICGPGALGCYGRRRLVAIGEDVRGVTATSVLMHEYGHHVAASRVNDPWPAVDWGTKRWASYTDVCRRTGAGELVPGDEGSYYQRNPGEVFAEDYRVLNERLAGIPESPWQVVDDSLYPDQGALDALASDVTSPWTEGTTTSYSGVLRATTSGRGFRPATVLDGDFTAKVTSGPGLRVTLRIVDPASGKILASDDSPLPEKTLGITVCGQRTVQVQVKRTAGSGPFALTLTQP